jgi:hypothetical protein
METIDTIVAKNLTAMTYEKTTTMLVACRSHQMVEDSILNNFAEFYFL